MKPRRLVRRVELVEKMRQPAPPEYDYIPRNRQQRRAFKRALTEAVKRELAAAAKRDGKRR